MKRFKIKKLNNQGSTFVMALIIIALITTLAVAIMAASAHNISMKNVDRNAKATFYTAESVMDEIRAGVGLDSMNQLGKAYENVLTTIIKEDEAGYSYIVDNEEANKEFKDIFVEGMLDRVSQGQMAFASGNETYQGINETDREFVKQYLQNFIKGYADGMASITSVGTVEAFKASGNGLDYMLIIRDVAVSYKEQKQGETYFSNVTADLELRFPNMSVDFSTTNRLNDYIDYAIVADNDFKIDGRYVDVKTSIYAGGVISVTSDNAMGGGHLNLSSDCTADGGTANVVCGGNNAGDAGTILVKGSTDLEASFKATGVNIWCTNLVTKPDTIGNSDESAGATIDIDEFCNTYVKDDLTIDGQDSVVNIDGQYYGYSYDGYDLNALHANSSAIIINGSRVKLTIGTTKMILGGHAYVEIGDDYYTTGEALAFKGDQEIYLIPAAYLGKNFGSPVPNPMPLDTWNALVAASEAEDSDVEICDIDGFFAEENGYLSAKPYTEKKINNLVYLYLNFADKDSAAKYVYDVASGSNGAPASLKNILNKYTASLFAEGGESGHVIIDAEESQIYTKGALLSTWGGAATGEGGTSSSEVNNWVGANTNNSLGNDEFVLTSLDLTNRYDIFTHLLAAIPWYDAETGKKYIVNDVDSALWQKKNYLVNGNEFSTSSVFDTIIDRDMLEVDEYNSTGAYIQYGPESENYTKVAVDGNYTIRSGCTGGIVIASGNVYVETDRFKGLIIAGGDIVVNSNSCVFTSFNQAETIMLIQNDLGFKGAEEITDTGFSEYFHAYKHAATDDDSREEVKVETVDYKDIVNFNNWRKYED